MAHAALLMGCVLVYCVTMKQAQQQDSALQQAQRQTEQHAAAAAAASAAAERCRVEVELLQRKVQGLEVERQELISRVEEDRAAAADARKQVRDRACADGVRHCGLLRKGPVWRGRAAEVACVVLLAWSHSTSGTHCNCGMCQVGTQRNTSTSFVVGNRHVAARQGCQRFAVLCCAVLHCMLQAMAMQGEQRSLLSALEAVESALHNARQACDEQTQLRQRYEVKFL